MAKYRKGVFFVIYAKNKKGNFEYLILKRQLHWKGWEFPKGGIEKRETHLKTIQREMDEETGLVPLNFKKFKIKGRYKYDRNLEDRPEMIGQTFESLYAVEVNKKKIKVDGIEHCDFRWVNYSDALKLLKWDNQKQSIKIVGEWLEKRKKIGAREFRTSSGSLIFMGKNKANNEKLVNEFKGQKNTIVHTLAPGSPFCVIDDLKPSKQDIMLSGAVCIRHSQDWRDNKSDTFVHVFNGKKVYKDKLMPLGTFGVKSPKKIKIKKIDIQKCKQ